MADILTKRERSVRMALIRSRDTKAELLLREALKGSYLRYQPPIDGRPDFAHKGKKVAVFVDGCFWHKCPTCYKAPASNTSYWLPKLERNAARDKQSTRRLRHAGWSVIRVWEHDVLKRPYAIANRIRNQLSKKANG